LSYTRAPSFVHLDVRSCFSLKEGAFTPEQLARRAAELRMPAVAMTDRDASTGVVSRGTRGGGGAVGVELVSIEVAPFLKRSSDPCALRASRDTATQSGPPSVSPNHGPRKDAPRPALGAKVTGSTNPRRMVAV